MGEEIAIQKLTAFPLLEPVKNLSRFWSGHLPDRALYGQMKGKHS